MGTLGPRVAIGNGRVGEVAIGGDGRRVQQETDLQRNFLGGQLHGVFLAVGTALTDPSTVIAAFVAQLTGSTAWVGGLSTVLNLATALPQPFAARWIEPRPRKMPYLLAAIYLRVASWGALAWLIHAIGGSNPQLLVWALVSLLGLFYAGGGLAGIPYNDIIGKVIPANRRGAFFGGRQALAAPLTVGAALLAQRVLPGIPFPDNYALLFGLAAASLSVASIGFWIIREPPRPDGGGQVLPWREYWRQLAATSRQLWVLVGVQVLTGFSLMALPFYVVYARRELGAPPEAVGWFMMLQVLGGMLANLLWAGLVDRHGSKPMLTVCAVLSSLTPILAVGLGSLGWMGMLPVFFLAGATYNGRTVGFNSALLRLAPEGERPTYTAMDTVLILPLAFLPLIAGLLLEHWPYWTLFLLVAAFVASGAALARRLPGKGSD